MKNILSLWLLLFVVSDAKSQDRANMKFQHITVSQDSRLDLLVKKNREINEDTYFKTLKTLQGFRVQVITTNDRNKAITVKTQLLSDFPDETTYLLYHSPYFKVQLGNFLSREDAGDLLEKVKKIYPSGVFVVPSKVEIKPSKDGEVVLEALNR